MENKERSPVDSCGDVRRIPVALGCAAIAALLLDPEQAVNLAEGLTRLLGLT